MKDINQHKPLQQTLSKLNHKKHKYLGGQCIDQKYPSRVSEGSFLNKQKQIKIEECLELKEGKTITIGKIWSKTADWF